MKKYFKLIPIIILLTWLPFKAAASVLVAESAQQNVYMGQEFVINWYLDTEGKNINALKLDIQYNADVLEAVNVEPGGSLISLWVQQPTVVAPGEISLEGGMPGGSSDKHLPIFRAVFKAKAPGNAYLKAASSSKVLLNDGAGDRDQLKFAEIHFPVSKGNAPVKVSSPTHPNQSSWYRENKVEIALDSLEQGREYSYSFSSNIDQIPDPVAMDVKKKMVFQNLPDGVYYFKLNVRTSQQNWQETAVYRVQIDSTPPQKIEMVLGADTSVFKGSPFLSFMGLDKTSGTAEYRIKVGAFGGFTRASSPVELKKPLIGDEVEVVAVDKAGNTRLEKIPYKGYLSKSEFYTVLAAAASFVAIVLGLWYARRKKKRT